MWNDFKYFSHKNWNIDSQVKHNCMTRFEGGSWEVPAQPARVSLPVLHNSTFVTEKSSGIPEI